MAHTMREVARRAGVSLATVSRVLNNSEYVSAETSRSVLEVVRELDYYKNVHARRLSTGCSDLFGLIISEIANPFFPEIIRGYQATAWSHGFDVLLCNTEYDRERTKMVMRKLRESDVRGVAVVTSAVDRDMASELTDAGIPLVFCNSDPATKLVGNIRIEYEHGVTKAIEHIVKLGHRRSAVIAGPAENRTAVTIKEALVSGLTARGLKPVCVLESNYRVDAGASAVREVLSRPEKPTVVFCGNDLIAMGAMSALEESGVRVPEDVSVLGIDNIFFAFLARPPLTTISVPREQLGVRAFEALDRMLKVKRQKGPNESEYSEGRDLFEHDVAYSNAPGTDWYWKRCKATGGKANFWGRSSARFGDIDFKAADLDGFGENWPVDYAEMAPWFSKAERYMGVASTIQNRPSNPDGEYLPPMPWRCIDHIIQKGAEKIGVPYLPDRCAQLTVEHNNHPACHYCGNCSRGCDVGSFFSPTWFTIPEAEATKNLTLLTNALVREVITDENGQAKGVAYIDRTSRTEVEVYARVVVLAASCVETAHIMLNSKSRHWPTGIANSSGQLGRNLCDHLYGCPGYGYLPHLLGQPARPDSIADSTVAWAPRWQNLKNPKEEKFIRGYSLYIGGWCGEFPGYYGQIEGFGSQYKRDIKRYYPTPISALIQAPSLPSAKNYVDIDPDKKDIFGIPELRFHFQWGSNELLMWQHSKKVMIDLFKAMGGEMWGMDDEPNRPGTSLHETGVCRFGNDPKMSVTNKWAQTHDVPNLYICDSSIFPSCTDKTTTMPIVAFAMRNCDHMLDTFKKGVHTRA